MLFALKYLIFDACIHKIFSNIENNFNETPIRNVPVVGEIYSRICHKYTNEVFFNCKILSVDEIESIPNEYIVYISYSEKIYDEEQDEFIFDEPLELIENDLSDDELKVYVSNSLGFEENELNDVSREELMQLIEDADMDYEDIDLIETENEHQIGLSTLYFDFFK